LAGNYPDAKDFSAQNIWRMNQFLWHIKVIKTLATGEGIALVK